MGYKVPDASWPRCITSAPESSSEGFCRNAPNTFKVWRDIRTSRPCRPILVSLHSVDGRCKHWRSGALATTMPATHPLRDGCHEIALSNPLSVRPQGRYPVLIRPALPPIFDSDVICAYLDTLHNGPPLIPPAGEARWQALQMQAVAQGLAEAGIAVRWETVRRPAALRFPALRDGYTQKLVAGYDWLERALDVGLPIHVGHIALATCLSWLEFRELPGFRGRPKLTQWFDDFSRRASMKATPLSGETRD